MLKSLQNKVFKRLTGKAIERKVNRVLKDNPTIQADPPAGSNIYTTIDELPFDKYLSVLIDGNYSALVKEGEADILHVVEAWHSIQEQYAMQIGGNKLDPNMRIYVDIARHEAELITIETFVSSLRAYWNEDVAQSLSEVVNHEVKPDNLDFILLTKKHIELQADTLKQAYLKGVTKANAAEISKALEDAEGDVNKAAELLSKDYPVERADKAVYDSILRQIDVKLKPSDITTFRFCTLYKELQERAKMLEKQNRKK